MEEQSQQNGAIPPFRADGYLPVGVHLATIAEITFRFGIENRMRKRLILRVRNWFELAKSIGARKLLLDGSFVTAKSNPQDVDAVMWIPKHFTVQVANGVSDALDLERMFLTRQPEELFAAEDESGWLNWIEFFSRTREVDGRRKGLIEVEL